MRLNRIPSITVLAKTLALLPAITQPIPYLRISAHRASLFVSFPALSRHSLCDALTIRGPQVFSPLLVPSAHRLSILAPGITPGYRLGGLYGGTGFFAVTGV